MTENRCHICGKEVNGTHYLCKGVYTCYNCAKKKNTDHNRFFIVETVNGRVISDKKEEYSATQDIGTVCDWLNSLNDEINQLRFELDTHKHPLWSTRQAEAKVNELVDTISELIEKNSELYDEINQLRIENMRLKALKEGVNDL